MRQAPHCLRGIYLAALFVLNALAQSDTEESALLDFADQLDNFQVLCNPNLSWDYLLLHLSRSVIKPADLVLASTPADLAQDLISSPHWHGWGKDTNFLCPSRQTVTYREQLCEPSYPGSIDPRSQSWTGITCTPEGKVLCLSLPGWGLQGNASALEQLQSLHSLQLVNLANNSLAGDLCSNGQQAVVCGCRLCLMQANAALTGTLPASLPASLETDNHGAFPTISVVYLSNNSIKGTLPSEWGKAVMGWGPTLERLYLDNNQLTGKLPQLWSDSNSLWSLGRVDLFNNQLTGSVDWDARHMPKLENLVLGPGERAKCQLRYPLFSHLPAAMLYSRSL